LAAALRIQQQVSVRSDHRVMVVGAGRLGQLNARALKLTGCISTRITSGRLENPAGNGLK
jgi:threonine dehydrogenase-like Zn-dependent dehydrogenase